jgi:aspartyl protease family protein
MSSATASLFASFLFAALGAAALAFILTHPGVVTTIASRYIGDAPVDARSTVPQPAAEPKRNPVSSDVVAIDATKYGHFETTAEINGRSIDVMVDTGATLVALTYDDADRLGIFVNPSDFTGRTATANGVARVAPVIIPRISIGNIMVRNVPGVVSERGKLDRTLLGMSFLGRLSRVEMRGRTLELQE